MTGTSGRSRASRAATLLLALFQLALAGPAVVLEGWRAVGEGREAAAHVESERSAACASAHARDCALCRYLSGGWTPPRGHVPAPAAILREAPEPALPLLVARELARDGLRTRAPPAIS
jgi:hypothetical protein